MPAEAKEKSRVGVGTVDKLKQRSEREGWQPFSIDSDAYRLELHQVHALNEVGFVLWRKGGDGQLDLVTSGHTFGDRLLGSEEEPLELTDEAEEAIEELLEH